MVILYPKLRFPEFKEKWYLDTFNQYFKIGSSKRVLQEDWQNEGIPFYRTRELVKLANNEIIQNELFIKENLYDELKNKYGIPVIGDLLISGVGTLGISYVINNENPFYFKDGNVIWFKKIKEINSIFFNYNFKSKFVQSQIFGNASITTVGTFTIDNANKTKFYLPNNIDEQNKIASFLSSIDNKINNLSKKKELLEQYKKGIMQKIFNQEIRFKDDNGNDYPKWTEAKLSDFKNLVHGDGDWILSNDLSKEGKHKLIQLGNIGYGVYKEKDLKTISAEKFIELKGTPIKKGDLLINRMVDSNLYCCILDKEGDYITSVDVCWIRDNDILNNYFLMSVLLFEKNQNKLLNLSSGSGRVRISKYNLFNEFYFMLPSFEEQTKIANFISAIDNKINQVVIQLEKTNDFKKGLLQQMFV